MTNETHVEHSDHTEQHSDLDESGLRYAAYASRIRNLAMASRRYIAYSSDYGEAFRPIVNQNFVRAAYGVSWLYVFYDVAKAAKYSHYTRQDSPQQTALVAVKRTVFQSLASMALPAFTIHSTVKIATKLLANSKLRRWGPTVAGMAVVPALPYLFDHPVEHVVDRVFDDYIEPALLGEENSKKSN